VSLLWDVINLYNSINAVNCYIWISANFPSMIRDEYISNFTLRIEPRLPEMGTAPLWSLSTSYDGMQWLHPPGPVALNTECHYHHKVLKNKVKYPPSPYLSLISC